MLPMTISEFIRIDRFSLNFVSVLTKLEQRQLLSIDTPLEFFSKSLLYKSKPCSDNLLTQKGLLVFYFTSVMAITWGLTVSCGK